MNIRRYQICAALVIGLCIGAVEGTSARAKGADVTPGKTSNDELDAWTREGDLGDLPLRSSDALPLSDQDNQGDWVVYEPLSDEFEGAELDQTKWTPRHRSWLGRKPAWFSTENVAVAAGQLQLTMKKDEPPAGLKRRGFHTYSSAAVHAKQLVKYGYFEVRAQPMNSAGSSSFWFAASDKRTRTEIDVFELSGKADGFSQRYNMNLHVFYSPDSQEHWSAGGRWTTPWPVGEDFHVYGLDWNERELTYFVDGVPVRRVENTHWHQPLYMIFDSETMPDWMGLPKEEDLPSVYRLDYVRGWKRRTEKGG